MKATIFYLALATLNVVFFIGHAVSGSAGMAVVALVGLVCCAAGALQAYDKHQKRQRPMLFYRDGVWYQQHK